jgi:hypothetical protein
MLPLLPRAPEAVIIVTAPVGSSDSLILSLTACGRVLPDLDDLLVALVLGDEAALVLAVDVVDLVVGGLQQRRLFRGTVMSLTAMVMPPRWRSGSRSA